MAVLGRPQLGSCRICERAFAFRLRRPLAACSTGSTSLASSSAVRLAGRRHASYNAPAPPPLLERIKDLRYDLRRLYRRAQTRSRTHQWEALVAAIVSLQLLVYALWKLAKGLDLSGCVTRIFRICSQSWISWQADLA
jgi:hypothetical protein